MGAGSRSGGFQGRVDGDLEPDGFQEKAPVRPRFLEIRYHIGCAIRAALP
ncbi:hypothetical protein WME94_30235 [Sorangium sp. So ce429]